MKFRTEYPAAKSPLTLSPSRPVLMLGSCFSDHIRERMTRAMWHAVNPAGTLYNPLSIAGALELCVLDAKGGDIFKDTLFSDGGIVHSWAFDSRMSAQDADLVRQRFVDASEEMRSTLEGAQVMFVTFGTAWCYYLKSKKDYVVANCHKQPSSLFERRRLSVGEIVAVWVGIAERLRECNPELEIVFTVSPVRHMKDGFEGNMRSKAILLLAVEEICNRLDFCHYFPAYEILNDDLRDYRFYSPDLVHPSEMAVDYVWEVFKTTYLDDDGCRRVGEGEKEYRRRTHRPIIR